MLNKPCLDCGTPAKGTRCTRCSAVYTKTRNDRQTLQRVLNGGRPQYGSQWSKISRGIRATATVCWLCGQGPRPNDPWQADHIIPAAKKTSGGEPAAAAAHRSCNISRANKIRAGKPDPATRILAKKRGRQAPATRHPRTDATPMPEEENKTS
jgi:hypothetical protein